MAFILKVLNGFNTVSRQNHIECVEIMLRPIPVVVSLSEIMLTVRVNVHCYTALEETVAGRWKKGTDDTGNHNFS